MTLAGYLSRLGAAIESGWRSFWFHPSSNVPLAKMRIVVALFSLYYLAGFLPDLTTWFAANGLLPRATVDRLVSGFGSEEVYRFSLLQLDDSSVFLWTVHAALAVNAVLLLLGIQARITSVINLVGVLSYIHRAPMLTGPFEAVLSMLALYLCLGPSGSALAYGKQASASATSSIAANISLRLMQVHLAGLHLMIGLNMLGGESWWTGDSIWWLLARPESRLFDLTGWTTGEKAVLVVNLLAHGVVMYHLSFGILVWPRITRPLLVLLSVPFWLFMLVVSGQVAYCLLMLAANLAFMPGAEWNSLFPSDWE